MSPPAYWPPGSPGERWCRRGAMPQSQARWDGRARRLLNQAAAEGAPPSRRVRPSASIALDRDPDQPPARRPRAVAGEGRAFGACCFAGKLRSPAHASGDAATRPTSGRRPLRHSPRQPLRHSLRVGGAYPGLRWPSASVLVSPPSGGVERPRRKERFARSIHRRGRAFGRTYGPRRLRRRSQAFPGCHPEWFGMSTTRDG
jgi:hypothetical protein